jgi:hypothetical protein
VRLNLAPFPREGADRDGGGASFTHHHDGEPYNTPSRHSTAKVTLSEALPQLWPDEGGGRGGRWWWPWGGAPPVHYLSLDMADLPYDFVGLLGTEQFLPAGCLPDDTRWSKLAGAGGAQASAAPAVCRGLVSQMWLGAPGVSAAAHYDLQHNIFVQVRATAGCALTLLASA